MVLPVKRWFAVAFQASAIAISQKAAFAAGDWKIIKVSGSDYLSVENISQFYGLPAGIAASGEKVEFDSVKNPLEFVSGSREVMINGARSWLCFPIIEQDGKYLVSRRKFAHRSPTPRAIRFSLAFISMRRMTIQTPQDLKSFRLPRAERRPHPTAR